MSMIQLMQASTREGRQHADERRPPTSVGTSTVRIADDEGQDDHDADRRGRRASHRTSKPLRNVLCGSSPNICRTAACRCRTAGRAPAGSRAGAGRSGRDGRRRSSARARPAPRTGSAPPAPSRGRRGSPPAPRGRRWRRERSARRSAGRCTTSSVIPVISATQAAKLPQAAREKDRNSAATMMSSSPADRRPARRPRRRSAGSARGPAAPGRGRTRWGP